MVFGRHCGDDVIAILLAIAIGTKEKVQCQKTTKAENNAIRCKTTTPA